MTDLKADPLVTTTLVERPGRDGPRVARICDEHVQSQIFAVF